MFHEKQTSFIIHVYVSVCNVYTEDIPTNHVATYKNVRKAQDVTGDARRDHIS